MKVRKSLGAFAAAYLLGAAVSIGWAQGLGTNANEQDLPELGSVANAAISLEDEYGAGLMMVHQMREKNMILDDPEVSQYIQEMGHSLSSHAEEGQHQFYYFFVKDPEINAFAVPGGFIAVNSGLMLATRNENELAGVLAHETAHVTQRHIARGIIDQSHAGLVSTVAMLAAILLGATAGHGSPDAMEGAIMATQGAAIQHQINYTRANEFEADRVGISTMVAAGYDPYGLPTFFETLNRGTPDPSRVRAIEFLIDHPVTSDRIAESRSRAEQIGRIYHTDSISYTLTRERLRSLVGNPQAAHDYYASLRKNGGGNSIEERYGKDVADIAIRKPEAAIPDLVTLVHDFPKITQFYGALGQAYLANGQIKESQAILDKAIDLFPRNVPITIRLSETLMRAGDNKRAMLLLDDLFNIVEPTPDQTKLIAKAANQAGDLADSYYYMSFFYVESGDLKMSANQLQLALGMPGLNAVQRARFSARLDEIRAAMPKEHKTATADEGNGRH